MIKTIVFNSPPNSGKDFLGEKLAEFLEGNVLRYKDNLYTETAQYMQQPLCRFIELATDRDTKDSNILYDYCREVYVTPREALMHVSENIIKPNKGKGYFGGQLVKQLTDGWNIITDGGFEEEFAPVAEASDRLYVIQLSADKCSFEGDSRDYFTYEFLKSFDNVELIKYFNQKDGKLTATIDLIRCLHFLEGVEINE